MQPSERSEHHQRLAMNEIDELCRKLDGLKRIALKQDNEEAFKEMLPADPITESESFAPFFKHCEGKSDQELEQQIGGS